MFAGRLPLGGKAGLLLSLGAALKRGEMMKPDRSRLTWVLSIRRFLEVAWTGHGATRFVSVLSIPVLVLVSTPGWWWVGCVAGATVGIGLDLYARAHFAKLADQLEKFNETELRGLMGRHVGVLSALLTCYAAPYAALAFAPSPGPAIGLMFCAASAIVVTSLHVMTRTMILYTIPAVAVGIIANAAALHPGWQAYVLVLLGGFLVVNAVVTARAGAASFSDLITARLEAEEAAQTLERRVAERTAELAEATHRAEAANRAKSMFLANMTHELRTPLNAVLGYAEIIAEDIASGDTAQCGEDLGKIRTSASHLLGLITEVLDLSRIESGKLELCPAQTDIGALMRRALDTVSPLALQHETSCELVIELGIEALYVDELRLRQCVVSLLSNATKFARGARVTASVRRALFNGEAALAFEVRDTGPGIAPADMPRLFQPFVQVDSSAARAHEGAGLGLVITRRLARLMGGDAVAESEPGRGAVFTIYIPERPVMEAAPASEAA